METSTVTAAAAGFDPMKLIQDIVKTLVKDMHPGKFHHYRIKHRYHNNTANKQRQSSNNGQRQRPCATNHGRGGQHERAYITRYGGRPYAGKAVDKILPHA